MAITLAALGQAAMIITSTMPKIYEINDHQHLIVFDEPSPSDFSESLPEGEQPSSYEDHAGT